MLYGHPKGRHLERRLWEPYRRAVHALFQKHTRDPALTAADELMASLLDPGQELRKANHYDVWWFRWRELKRIQGVSPRLALEVAAAVFCCVWEQPRTLPNDQECLNRQMARAVLKLRELSGYSLWDHRTRKQRKLRVHTPGSLVVAPLGKELREAFGMFFIQVSKALAAEKYARNLSITTSPATKG